MKRWHWIALGVGVLLLVGGGAVAFSLYRQGDPRWAKKLLGQSTSRTIGTSGCLLTAVTMAHNAFYKAGLTPDRANDQILAAGGFEGANLKQDVAARVLRMKTPGVTRLSGVNYAALAATAASALKQGGAVILHVAHDGDLTGDHFILVTGQRPDGGFDALDPGFGNGRVKLDRLLHGTSGTKQFAPVSVRPYFKA